MDYPFYLSLVHYLSRKRYPLDSTEKVKRKIRFHANKYVLVDGRLYQSTNDPQIRGREVLHEGTVNEIIQVVHNEGHFGINNTWRRLQMAYTGPALFERVRTIVQSCGTCQFRARVRRTRHNPSKPIDTPSDPFYMVGCDAVGPIHYEGQPPRYLLVAIDYLTRWPIAAVVDNINEETTAEFLFTHLVQMFGVPRYLLTDRGSNFTSRYVFEFLKKLGCRHITTTSGRAQVNGLCERMNQGIVQTIAKLARQEGDEKNWERYVTHALMAIRTMPNEATGFSPAKLLFGYELRTPATWPAPRKDFVEGELVEEIISRTKVIEYMSSQLREEAKEKSRQRKAKDKMLYDQRVAFRKPFKIGDQVLMRDKVPEGKFSDRWLGPMVVVGIGAPHMSELTHCVVVLFGQTKDKVHVICELEFTAQTVMNPLIKQQRIHTSISWGKHIPNFL
ncbi:hypothetical protein INT45_009411 [Circinella minor]|uniref:Integrase catalytic domain-containing protein n=1 Tax=Circinella minor TaxID=1195481 RepID=A0A8H7RSA5_9FUNG|nr:hypothetical protein INT45_009411 [Circinella minor]